MADTTFTAGTTIESDWLNDVNNLRYDTDGAQYVSFLQSGSGAVAGDVQTELRYFIRPEQFGAVGDNTTDDRAALALAATAAANRILYITKPHKISSNLTLGNTITLFFDRGGSLNPDTGVTLTVNSDVHSVRKVADTFGGAGTSTLAATIHRIFKDQFKFDSTPGARGCSIGTGTGEGPQFDVQFYMTGDWTPTDLPNAVGFQMDTQLTPRDTDTVVRGMQLSPKLITKASGTHPDFTALYIQPDFTANGATVGNYAGVRILTVAVPSPTSEAHGLQVQAPTGASENNAIYVVAGNTRLDGSLTAKGAVTLASDGAANSTITIGGAASANNAAQIRLLPSNNNTNWQISSNQGLLGQNAAFQITPSTAGGGSTFTTPVFDAISTGIGVGGRAASATTALITPAGSTSISPFRIPHGSAPTSPVDGDVWSTTTAMFHRINGVTKQVAYV